MTDRPTPPPKVTPEERVKKAIELLKQIKHQSAEVDSEGRKYKSQRLVELGHEIDVACTDALNNLYGVKV